jgi:hypothetical protein
MMTWMIAAEVAQPDMFEDIMMRISFELNSPAFLVHLSRAAVSCVYRVKNLSQPGDPELQGPAGFFEVLACQLRARSENKKGQSGNEVTKWLGFRV